MASTLNSAPSLLSFSPQTTLICPLAALTFSLPLLLLVLLSLSPLPTQRQWLQGSTLFIATFSCHMISAKGTDSAGIEYQVWARGELLKEREEGSAEGGWKEGDNTELEVQRQKADKRRQKWLFRSLHSHFPILSKLYLQWEQNSIGFLILSPDIRCPKD